MRQKIISLILAFCTLQSIRSQEDVYKQSVLPPSPETAAFAKNINIPVSYSTGTPQINIPFSTVKSGNLEVPISLSYNASGIRVEEVPSWVGLGWSLNAGGQIVRSVRGLPDEWGDFGYMVAPYYRKIKYIDSILYGPCDLVTGPNGSFVSEIIDDYFHENSLDLEPDEYRFSIVGYSGSFYYNQDSAKFITLPYQNILIEGSPLAGYFILTLPDGVKCYFGNCTNCTETFLNGSTASYIDNQSQAAVDIPVAGYNNSWEVSKIASPTGKEINFEYTSETIITFGRGTEKFGQSISETSNQYRTQSFFKQFIKKPILSVISGESGKVHFKKSSTARLDMPNYNGGSKYLDTVVVTNANDEPLRSFHLDYDYFVSPSYSTGGILHITAYAEEARRRLYLKSIREKNGTDSLPPYVFTYNETELPSRFSTSQDYWGYFNGKSNGFHIMPRIPQLPFFAFAPTYNETNHILPDYAYTNYDGADRRVDTNYTQARILKKIQYPTGGTTEYFYEANVAATVHNLNTYGGIEPPDMVDRSYTFNLLSNPIPSEPPYPLYFKGTFTVNYPSTKLKITPVLPTCTTYVDASCILEVKIKRLPDSALVTSINTTSAHYLQVPRGNYLIEVFVDGSSDDYPPSFNVNIQWGERSDSANFIVGGVRVRKIISSDSVAGTISRSYRYNYEDSLLSSGTLEGVPVYKVIETNCHGAYNRYFTSNPVLPLSREGRTIRYRFVSEFYDTTKSSFKTNYTFTSGLSDPSSISLGAKYDNPRMYWDWQNNLLKKKEVYEKTQSGAYRILSSEEHFYQFYQPLTEVCGFHQINPTYDFFIGISFINGLVSSTYSIPNEWYLPDSTISTAYSYAGNTQTALQTTSKTLYNNRYLPSLTRTTNSKGEVIHSKTWYPTDYNNVSGYSIAALNSKHILRLPVKQEISVNGKIRSGNIIKYNEWGQLLDGYSYENAVLSDTVAHNRNTVLESSYNLKTSLRYDINGNLKQLVDNKTDNTTYVWDYSNDPYTGLPMNEVPVAMIQNADSNSVAYCSFEAAGEGRWTFAHSPATDASSPMGKKCHVLTGNSLSKTGLTSSTAYIVSYWSKNGSYTLTSNPVAKQGKTLNGWTYYEHEVTGITSLTISGTGYIDEVRLYPKGALMTTYDYKHGVGLNSQSDPSGHITYYEYDDMQRLSLVRNEDRQILKKICYSYTGQPVNCGYDTTAAWISITSTCQQSGGNNTGYMIVTEKNMNPSSATYNQTRTVLVASGGACRVCDSSSCSGVDKKCLNNTCETGVKVYTGQVKLGGGQWRCYYHYLWSDSSVSPTYDEIHSNPCPL